MSAGQLTSNAISRGVAAEKWVILVDRLKQRQSDSASAFDNFEFGTDIMESLLPLLVDSPAFQQEPLAYLSKVLESGLITSELVSVALLRYVQPFLAGAAAIANFYIGARLEPIAQVLLAHWIDIPEKSSGKMTSGLEGTPADIEGLLDALEGEGGSAGPVPSYPYLYSLFGRLLAVMRMKGDLFGPEGLAKLVTLENGLSAHKRIGESSGSVSKGQAAAALRGNHRESNMHSLGTELLVRVLALSTTQSLARCMRVCKGWRSIIDSHDEQLWRWRAKEEFKVEAPCNVIGGDHKTWKALCHCQDLTSRKRIKGDFQHRLYPKIPTLPDVWHLQPDQDEQMMYCMNRADTHGEVDGLFIRRKGGRHSIVMQTGELLSSVHDVNNTYAHIEILERAVQPSSAMADKDTHNQRRIILFKSPVKKTCATALPDPYTHLFKSAGFEVYFVPVLEETFVNQDKLKRTLVGETIARSDSDEGEGWTDVATRYDAVVATSQRAGTAWLNAVSEICRSTRPRSPKSKGKGRARAGRNLLHTASDCVDVKQGSWTTVPLFTPGPSTTAAFDPSGLDLSNTGDTPPEVECDENGDVDASSYLPTPFPGADETGSASALGEFMIANRAKWAKSGTKGTVLILTGDKTLSELPDVLWSAGVEVDEVEVYGTAPRTSLGADLRRLFTALDFNGGAKEEGAITPDLASPIWLAFFSPSSAQAVLSLLSSDVGIDRFDTPNFRLAAIGQTTGKWLEHDEGWQVDAIPGKPTAGGLVEAIVQAEHTEKARGRWAQA